MIITGKRSDSRIEIGYLTVVPEYEYVNIKYLGQAKSTLSRANPPNSH
jgi:hypothetical protein